MAYTSSNHKLSLILIITITFVNNIVNGSIAGNKVT